MTIRKDKKFKHGEAMRWITKPPVPRSEKLAAKEVVKDFYEKAAIDKAY